MDFFIEQLKDVLEAVNKGIENHRLTINTRNIRRLYDIESFLDSGFITKNGCTSVINDVNF